METIILPTSVPLTSDQNQPFLMEMNIAFGYVATKFIRSRLYIQISNKYTISSTSTLFSNLRPQIALKNIFF